MKLLWSDVCTDVNNEWAGLINLPQQTTRGRLML